MASYFLQPADVVTLNVAADYAKKGADAAAKAAGKVYLTEAESEALSLSGYAEESKHFLGHMIGGRADLGDNHREALKAGLRMLYADIQKTREREALQLIDTDGTDERLGELRRIVTKLRLNVQLDLEDEVEAAAPAQGDPAADRTGRVTVTVAARDGDTPEDAARRTRVGDKLEAALTGAGVPFARAGE